MKTLGALAFALGLVSPLTISAAVNPDGSFSHEIAIESPAGKLGLEPKLSLVYNSNGGNGAFGMGWQLAGLSAIARMNFGNGITYTSADTFTGAAGRLVQVSTNPVLYKYYEDNGSLIEPFGNCGTGPCEFLVRERNGIKLYYGSTSASRAYAAGRSEVRVWALAKVEDTNGNYFTVDYLQAGGEIYPQKIVYTQGAGVWVHHSIEFEYEGRSDQEISYAQSAQVVTGLRVKNIFVKSGITDVWLWDLFGGELIRRYELLYAPSSVTGRSILTSFRELAGNNSSTLHQHTFNWQASNLSANYSGTLLSSWNSSIELGRYHLGDFDGDGMTDLATIELNGSITVRTIKGATFQIFPAWGASDIMSRFRFADFNGDGKLDVAAIQVNGGVTAYITDGSTVNLLTAWGTSDFDRYHFGDFDGDGKADLATIEINGSVTVRPTAGAAPWQLHALWGATDRNRYRFADFNGDGKTDLATIEINGAVTVRSSTGYAIGQMYSLLAGWGATDLTRYQFQDFNGDGKTDLALIEMNGAVTVRLSTGVGAAPAYQIFGAWGAPQLNRYRFGDFDGDGQADLATIEMLGAVTMRTMAGNKLTQLFPNWGTTELDRYRFADVNGDGRTDLVRIELNGGVSVNYSTSVPDLMQSVTVDSVRTQQLQYTVLSQTANGWQAGAGSCGAACGYSMSSSRAVVTQVQILTNASVVGNEAYQYLGNRFYPGGVGTARPLGFQRITKTISPSHRYNVTTFNHDYRFAGSPKRQDEYLSTGELVSRVDHSEPTQYVCPTDGGCVADANIDLYTPRQIRPGKTVSTQYESGFAALTSEKEITAYDGYGSPTAIVERKSGNGLTREVFTYTDYINDTTTGRQLGLPFHKKTCVLDCSAENTLSEERYYFDNLALGSIGAEARVTKKETRLGTIWATESFEYVTGGNVFAKVEATGARTEFTYDSGEYNQYVSQTKVISSDGAKALIRTQEIEPKFGKTVKTENEVGLETRIVQLDSRGRPLVKTIRANDNALLRREHKQYDDTPSRPTVTTCALYSSVANAGTFDQQSCSRIVYDAFGREVIKIAPATEGANNNATYSAKKTEFDSLGRKWRESLPYFSDLDGTPVQGQTLRYMTVSYDARDRASRITRPDGFHTDTDYSQAGLVANSVAVKTTIDEKGIIKKTWYDLNEKPVKVQDAVGDAQSMQVSYTYLPDSPLASVTSPQGTSYIDYHANTKQQKSITDPNVGKTSYTYFETPGEAKFLKVATESRPAANSGSTGVLVMIEYNEPWGRVTKKSSTQIGLAGVPTFETAFVYDENDVAFGLGRVTTSVHRENDCVYQTRSAYDIFGEVKTTTTDISHATLALCSSPTAMPCHSVVSHSFDELGRKISITYPDQKVSAIQYGGGTGSVTKISHNGIDYATYSKYNEYAKMGRVAYHNDTSTDYSYEMNTGLLDTLITKNASAQNIQSLDYAFDAGGNISQINDNVLPNASYTYQYDKLNRLGRAERGDGRNMSYVFDPSGNLIQKHNHTMLFQAYSTRLAASMLNTAVGPEMTTYTWSPSGNMLTRQALTDSANYTYNAQNMMTRMTKVGGIQNGAVNEHYYDAAGERFLKVYSQPGKQTIRTWYMGPGFEMREAFSGATRDHFQVSKFILGVDGGKIASITASVDSMNLAAMPAYHQTMLAMYNGQSVGGFISSASHTMYLAVAYGGVYKKEILVAIILLCLLGAILILRSQLPSWRTVTATVLTFAMFNFANCSTSRQDPSLIAVDPAAPATVAAINDLYTGLPVGTAYYHTNHLGSSTVITDEAGEEKLRTHYLPYGEVDQTLSGKYDQTTHTLIPANASQVGDALLGVKFTGQEYDPENELYYYHARFMDPTLGMFTSADSEIDKNAGLMGFNRYTYVAGNPIKYTDPTGHFLWFIVLAVVAIAAATVVAGTKGNVKGWINGDVKFDLKAGLIAAASTALAIVTAGAGAALGAGVFGTATLGAAAATGAVAGFAGGFVGASTNVWLNGGSFGDGMLAGLIAGGIGAAVGGLLGAAQFGLKGKPSAKSPDGEGGERYRGGNGNLGDAPDIPGDVEIIDSTKPDQPGFWDTIDDFSNKKHYPPPGTDTVSKVDLPHSWNNSLEWYGPNSKFRVDQVVTGERGWGSRIQISALNLDRTVRAKLNLIHFTEINAKIYNGVGQTFDAGTYIGATRRAIGWSTGAHLHMEIIAGGSTRHDMYNIMRGH